MAFDLPPIIVAPGSADIRATGMFSPGTTVVFYFDFRDQTGQLYDPSDISVTITDPDSTDVGTAAGVEKVGVGQYAVGWQIASDATQGTYTIALEYTAETEGGIVVASTEEEFVVGEASVIAISAQETALRGSLEELLGETQDIPVRNEPGKFNTNRTVLSFTFPRWNQPQGITMYLNGELKELGYTVDYMAGKIYFDNALSTVDQVDVDYNFRWFTDGELYNFIDNALQTFNQYAPHTIYSAGSLPLRYGNTVVMQATVYALRRLMMDLMYQEPAIVFGGMDRADKIMGYMDTLKKNYEDELKLLYQEKKKMPYVGLTRQIVVPEYTLPGGRSRWFRYLFKSS